MNKFTVAQNRKFWNEYAKKSRDRPHGAHTDRHVVELENLFITTELKTRKIKHLLDVGCGNGQRTLIFSKYATKTLGIDYSKTMIEEAEDLLSRQKKEIRKKLSFKCTDIHDFQNEKLFNVIISCRSFINQPSFEKQVKLFNMLHNKLVLGGSLIIAEESFEGIKQLNLLRSKHRLGPIKVRWHNLPVKESFVFSKINHLFDIKQINRLGIFYYVSRVLHPRLVFPDEPNPNAVINDIGMDSEIIFQNLLKKTNNPFEKFGAPLLVHFIKK